LMNLTDMVFQGKDLERVCLLQGEESWSYRELGERVSGVSDFLRRECGKGERVGILAENGMEFASAYLGSLFGELGGRILAMMAAMK